MFGSAVVGIFDTKRTRRAATVISLAFDNLLKLIIAKNRQPKNLYQRIVWFNKCTTHL